MVRQKIFDRKGTEYPLDGIQVLPASSDRKVRTALTTRTTDMFEIKKDKSRIKTAVRMIAAALALLMILPSFASCGGDAGNAGNADTPSASSAVSETAAPAETEPEVPPMSELKNFKGQKFTFLTRAGDWLGEFNVDEANGDIENDAVYNRNLATEEKYNVKFAFDAHVDDWSHHEEFDNLIHNNVLAGDALYDAVAGYQCCLAYNVAWGDLLDLMALPYFDFSSRWWS